VILKLIVRETHVQPNPNGSAAMSQRKSVTLHQAKTHLPRLLDEVDNGVEVIIVRAGKPLVKLVPLVAAEAARKAGFLKGKIRIADATPTNTRCGTSPPRAARAKGSFKRPPRGAASSRGSSASATRPVAVSPDLRRQIDALHETHQGS